MKPIDANTTRGLSHFPLNISDSASNSSYILKMGITQVHNSSQHLLTKASLASRKNERNQAIPQLYVYNTLGDGTCFFRAYLAQAKRDPDWLMNKPLEDIYSWMNSEKALLNNAINNAIKAMSQRDYTQDIPSDFVEILMKSHSEGGFGDDFLSTMMQKNEFMLWRKEVVLDFLNYYFNSNLTTEFCAEFIDCIYQSIAEEIKAPLNQNNELYIKRISTENQEYHHILLGPDDFFWKENKSGSMKKVKGEGIYTGKEKEKKADEEEDTDKLQTTYEYKTKNSDGTSFFRSYLAILNNDTSWLLEKNYSEVRLWIESHRSEFKEAIKSSISALKTDKFSLEYFLGYEKIKIIDSFLSDDFLGSMMRNDKFLLFNPEAITSYARKKDISLCADIAEEFIRKVISNLAKKFNMIEGYDGDLHQGAFTIKIKAPSRLDKKKGTFDCDKTHHFIPMSLDHQLNGKCVSPKVTTDNFNILFNQYPVQGSQHQSRFQAIDKKGTLYRSILFLNSGGNDSLYVSDKKVSSLFIENKFCMKHFTASLCEVLSPITEFELTKKEWAVLAKMIVHNYFKKGEYDLNKILNAMQRKSGHKNMMRKINCLLSEINMNKDIFLRENINDRFEYLLISKLKIPVVDDNNNDGKTEETHYLIKEIEGVYSVVAPKNIQDIRMCDLNEKSLVSKNEAIHAGAALLASFLGVTADAAFQSGYNINPHVKKPHQPSQKKGNREIEKITQEERLWEKENTQEILENEYFCLKKDKNACSSEKSRSYLKSAAQRNEKMKQKDVPKQKEALKQNDNAIQDASLPINTDSGKSTSTWTDWLKFPGAEGGLITTSSTPKITPEEYEESLTKNKEPSESNEEIKEKHDTFEEKHIGNKGNKGKRRNKRLTGFIFWQPQNELLEVFPLISPNTPFITTIVEVIQENENDHPIIEGKQLSILEGIKLGASELVTSLYKNLPRFITNTEELEKNYNFDHAPTDIKEIKKIMTSSKGLLGHTLGIEKMEKNNDEFDICDLRNIIDPSAQAQDILKMLFDDIENIVRAKSMSEEAKKNFRKTYLDHFRENRVHTAWEAFERGMDSMWNGGIPESAILIQMQKDLESHQEMTTWEPATIYGMTLASHVWATAMGFILPEKFVLDSVIALGKAAYSGKATVCDYVKTAAVSALVVVPHIIKSPAEFRKTGQGEMLDKTSINGLSEEQTQAISEAYNNAAETSPSSLAKEIKEKFSYLKKNERLNTIEIMDDRKIKVIQNIKSKLDSEQYVHKNIGSNSVTLEGSHPGTYDIEGIGNGFYLLENEKRYFPGIFRETKQSNILKLLNKDNQSYYEGQEQLILTKTPASKRSELSRIMRSIKDDCITEIRNNEGTLSNEYFNNILKNHNVEEFQGVTLHASNVIKSQTGEVLISSPTLMLGETECVLVNLKEKSGNEIRFIALNRWINDLNSKYGLKEGELKVINGVFDSEIYALHDSENGVIPMMKNQESLSTLYLSSPEIKKMTSIFTSKFSEYTKTLLTEKVELLIKASLELDTSIINTMGQYETMLSKEMIKLGFTPSEIITAYTESGPNEQIRANKAQSFIMNQNGKPEVFVIDNNLRNFSSIDLAGKHSIKIRSLHEWQEAMAEHWNIDKNKVSMVSGLKINTPSELKSIITELNNKTSFNLREFGSVNGVIYPLERDLKGNYRIQYPDGKKSIQIFTKEHKGSQTLKRTNGVPERISNNHFSLSNKIKEVISEAIGLPSFNRAQVIYLVEILNEAKEMKINNKNAFIKDFQKSKMHLPYAAREQMQRAFSNVFDRAQLDQNIMSLSETFKKMAESKDAMRYKKILDEAYDITAYYPREKAMEIEQTLQNIGEAILDLKEKEIFLKRKELFFIKEVAQSEIKILNHEDAKIYQLEEGLKYTVDAEHVTKETYIKSKAELFDLKALKYNPTLAELFTEIDEIDKYDLNFEDLDHEISNIKRTEIMRLKSKIFTSLEPQMKNANIISVNFILNKLSSIKDLGIQTALKEYVYKKFGTSVSFHAGSKLDALLTSSHGTFLELEDVDSHDKLRINNMLDNIRAYAREETINFNRVRSPLIVNRILLEKYPALKLNLEEAINYDADFDSLRSNLMKEIEIEKLKTMELASSDLALKRETLRHKLSMLTDISEHQKDMLKQNLFTEISLNTDESVKSLLFDDVQSALSTETNKSVSIATLPNGKILKLVETSSGRFSPMDRDGHVFEEVSYVKIEGQYLISEEEHVRLRCKRGGGACPVPNPEIYKAKFSTLFDKFSQENVSSRNNIRKLSKHIRKLKEGFGYEKSLEIFNESLSNYESLMSSEVLDIINFVKDEMLLNEINYSLFSGNAMAYVPALSNSIATILERKEFTTQEQMILDAQLIEFDILPSSKQTEVIKLLKNTIEQYPKENAYIKELNEYLIDKIALYQLINNGGDFFTPTVTPEISPLRIQIGKERNILSTPPGSSEFQYGFASKSIFTVKKGALGLEYINEKGFTEKGSFVDTSYKFVIEKNKDNFDVKLVNDSLSGSLSSLTKGNGVYLTGRLTIKEGKVSSWTMNQRSEIYLDRLMSLPEDVLNILPIEKLIKTCTINFENPMSPLVGIREYPKVEKVGSDFNTDDLMYHSSLQHSANKYNVVIGVRAPSKLGQLHIKRHYPTKNFHIKAKSSVMGPTAGFIAVKPEFSKVSQSSWIKQEERINDALSKGAQAVNLILDAEQIQQLLTKEVMSVASDKVMLDRSVYEADYHGKKYYFTIDHDGLVREMNDEPVKVLTNPPESDGQTSDPKPTTADYDLFSINTRPSMDANQLPVEIGEFSDLTRRSSNEFKERVSTYSGSKINMDAGEMHPDRGNFHTYGNSLIKDLNKNVANEGYKGGNIFWHGDEFSNPYSEGFDPNDAPIFFIPGEKPQQIHTLEELKVFFNALKKAGYSVKYNPRFQ